MTRQSFIKFFATLLPVIAGLWLPITSVSADNNAVADYDAHLCRYAQHFLVNASSEAFPVIEQIGYGNGFHVIQMDIDAEQRQVSIAMTSHFTQLDGKKLTTYVACKTVDRAR
ncbi:MAG: hypothetical protein CL797_11640, partial [Chromatiales bacterium]|nr:hypothetical protein [Chromatiales bacterium]